MVYISSDGTIREGRPLTPGSIGAMFWGFIEFIILFFRTMFNPYLSKNGTDRMANDYRRPGGRGPRPPPSRRFRSFGSGSSPGPPPVIGGG